MVARRHSVRKATIRRTIEAVISAGHIVSAVKLGWTAVRVRDLTRGGYKEQVRGYCRDSHHSTAPNRECAPVGSSAPV